MSLEQIMSDLKNKQYKPIYILQGEETYYIDLISNYIAEHVLTESEKTFNQTVVYGKDTDIETVINGAKRFPMMASHQVFIVKEAQNLKNIEDLVHYANAPLSSTLLVICHKYKTLDKRKKLHKAADKAGVVFTSAKLYDNKIPDWINAYLKQKGFTTDPGISQMLSEYLGNDLSKISNELEKLMITMPAGTQKINANHVEKNIGISKDYNVFELQKAIMFKDIPKANKIVDYFGKNQKNNPFPVTVVTLFNLFQKVLIYHFLQDKSRTNAASELKVNPYFIGDYQEAAKNYNPRKTVAAISTIREYDMKSKGVDNVSTSPEELLRELVFKILYR